jgi:hypothetical protein
LQVLIDLYKANPQMAHLSTDEIFLHLYPISDNREAGKVAQSVIASRTNKSLPEIQLSSTEVTSRRRNITDFMGFLCKTEYAFYKENSIIGLNLLGKHPTERTYYWKYHSAQTKSDKVQRITDLIDGALKNG